MTFSMLIAFTAFTLANILGYTSTRVYAQAIAEQGNWREKPLFVVVKAQESASPLLRILDRLTKRQSEEKALCGLTSAQVAAVSQETDLTMRQITIGDRQITLAVPEDRGFNRNELLGAMETHHQDSVHCSLFQTYQQVLLQLSGHLS